MAYLGDRRSHRGQIDQIWRVGRWHTLTDGEVAAGPGLLRAQAVDVACCFDTDYVCICLVIRNNLLEAQFSNIEQVEQELEYKDW